MNQIISVPFTAELTVEDYLRGVRIDSFLIRHFRNYTSFRMQRMVRADQVRLNGVPVELRRRVFSGERYTVRLTEPPDKLIDPEPLPLEVLFEDPWLIVVNKPAGQVTHPVGEFQTKTLCNALQYHLDRQTPLRGLLRPGIVHRLDRETSGILVITKEHLSHRRLSIQFQKGEVQKEYLALVEGEPAEEQGTIDAPIGQLGKVSSILMSVDGDARNPRPARTDYEVVDSFEGYSLVKVSPRTGRIHQIRVHLASIGHPVVGDEFYGPFGEIRQPARSLWKQAEHPAHSIRTVDTTVIDGFEGGRHALHASQLKFCHPITDRELQFQAPLPVDMQRVV